MTAIGGGSMAKRPSKTARARGTHTHIIISLSNDIHIDINCIIIYT